MGALGEHRFGVARGARDIAYVRLSAGIGLGLILNGEPYRGRLGIAGELGHVRAVVDGGALCRCGNRGCLETVASAAAVADSLGVHVPLVVELVTAGDERALRAVAAAGEAVGTAVAAVVNVLNPELVVIGGELARARPGTARPAAAGDRGVGDPAVGGGGGDAGGRARRARGGARRGGARAGGRAEAAGAPARRA